MNKPFLMIMGFVVLMCGMTLVLHFWPETVIVFKGVFPAMMAVFGLVLMLAASFKR